MGFSSRPSFVRHAVTVAAICSADGEPVRLRRAVRDRRQIGGIVAIENRLLARIEAERRLQTDERVVRGRRDRGRGEVCAGAGAVGRNGR